MQMCDLQSLVNLVCDTSLDNGVRKHLARALRAQVVVLTNDVLKGKARTDRLTRQEIESGRNDGKIPCIKLVRERCGLGLKEAKDLVEDEFIRLGYSFKGYETLPVKACWEQ